MTAEARDICGVSADPATRALKAFVIALAVGALLCSVALRIPFLERPISNKRHGEGTARTLRHIAIWDAVGLGETHWMMRTTGTAPADRYIADQGYLRDDSGIYYYVSFPPLFPLAPYATFKLLGVEAAPLAVRIFNLGLQALGTLALFLLAKRATASLGERFSWMAGGFAAVLYATAPVLLWYHSNAYTTASLSTPLFILAVYLAVRAVHDDSAPRWVLPAFGMAIFAVAYTEWLGVTFAAAAAVYGIARRRDRAARRMAIVAVAVVGATMLLMVAQYSSVAGLQAFVSGISGKYAMRSGVSEASHHSIFALKSWAYIAGYYLKGYLPFLGLIPLFAAPALWGAWRRRNRDKVLPRTDSAPFRAWFATPLATALALTSGPVMLHHLLLFSHTAVHDFDMVKSASVLGLLFGLAVAGMDRAARSSADPWRTQATLAIAVALITTSSMVLSYRRDFTSHSGLAAVGEAIKKAGVPPERIVFVQGNSFYVGSAAIYYAGRNIAYYSPEYARALVEASGAGGGTLFVIAEDGEGISAIERVGDDGVVIGAGE
ncbi:MAG: hypothetical protein Q8K99_05300 [Actinomycetota bacterium]|nr:hypothetical protein [Actinomycetota bacterium]